MHSLAEVKQIAQMC